MAGRAGNHLGGNLSPEAAGDWDLEACGGVSRFAEILRAVPTTLHAEDYARIVATKAT